MNPLKHCGKAVVLGAGQFLAGCFQPRRVILCYHSIHPSRPFRSATPAHFAAHLDWLGEHCEVVPLSALIAPCEARPRVAITFDDGYADNHEFALPLLVERRMPATFYVTTGYLDRDPAVLARFAELRHVALSEVEPLSWTQLGEIAAAGMDIGAHTFSHPNLIHLDAQRLAREVAEPKTALEAKLDRPVLSFAYPFGRPGRHVNAAAVAAVRAAGFKTAVTALDRGVRADDSPLTLPRFFASNTSLEMLASKVRGAWDVAGLIQERMPRWLARRISPEAEMA